ncbi:MAG: stage II sporulation protein P [Clostridia bacterium]|nr:stage II sporulation protein P [Clostridia bacterium]
MVLRGKLNEFSIFAANMIFFNGNRDTVNIEDSLRDTIESRVYIPNVITFGREWDKAASDPGSPDDIDAIVQAIPPFELPHEDGEPTYKIVECLFGASGDKFDNIYINNKTDVNLDIGSILNQRPDITVNNNGEPQVLVVHTHTSEAYMDKDQGFYYQNFHARTTDPRFNVVQVGNAICKSLEDAGIKAVHDTTVHDEPTFTGSYKRSEETVKKNLERYPSISVVLDIHRDTIENKERRKIKPTFSYNGKKVAQVMIIAGCDTDGSLQYPDWQCNLKLALKLHKKLETMYPGMTRSLLFKHARYNMHLTHGSMLIEVGSDANTLNEAVVSGALLGRALGDLLKELQ